MRAKEALAAAAGQAAVRYLEGCGFTILDRDWPGPDGMISIVAAERGTLVAVELRVRAGTRHGAPLCPLSADRRTAMRGLAVRWMTGHGVRFDRVRIDVVGLLHDGPGGFTIEHVRAVG
jgi:putative endonuclease